MYCSLQRLMFMYLYVYRYTTRTSNAHSQEFAVHEGAPEPCPLSRQHLGNCLAPGAHHSAGTFILLSYFSMTNL